MVKKSEFTPNSESRESNHEACACKKGVGKEKRIPDKVTIAGREVPIPEEAISRRDFMHKGLSLVSWGLLVGVTGVSAAEGVRFFAPAVIFKPPSTFEVGAIKDFVSNNRPDDKGVIFVNAAWKKAHRFFIVREPERLYAISAVCTHLGCTVDWMDGLNIYKCPCHGSQFYSNGVNFAGPAPRPLDWLHIEMKHSGIISVDTARVFQRTEAENNKVYINMKA